MTRQERKEWTRETYSFLKGSLSALVDTIYNDFESRNCDNCTHRVFSAMHSLTKTQIDKCDIRDQLLFNGSCDGLSCSKWLKNKELK